MENYDNMNTLEIKNVGPIKSVNITLNKFNIFIGPQSSGKSTLAKIISFSHWLEKDVLVHQDIEYTTISNFLEDNLIKFHKLNGYFKEDSYVCYHGDIITYRIEGKESLIIEKIDSLEDKKVGKIAYIPSERNLITLQGIESLPLSRDNIRTFLFDWLSIHRRYSKDNSFDILDLGIKFYFDEDSRQDTILLKDGNKITLDVASSGLQSLVPLCIYFYDVVKWVYDHIEDISFQKRNLYLNLIYRPLLDELKEKGALNEDILNNDQYKGQLTEALTQLTTEYRKLRAKISVEKFPQRLEQIIMLEENITKPHYSSIIIEEPEQNLFPQTQEKLLYYFLRLMDKNRDKLIITTHSPYILYALNNCMLGWLVKDEIESEEDLEALRFRESWVDPSKVSVWEIREGHIMGINKHENCTIQDEDGLISSNYFDRIMKNITSDFTELLQYLPDTI